MSLNAEVLVVVIVEGCGHDSWSQDCFQLLLTTYLCHRMPIEGYQKQYLRTCAIIQIKFICQHCVTCLAIRTDPGIPPPGYSASPRARVSGPGTRTDTGAGDTVWQPTPNLYSPYFTDSMLSCISTRNIIVFCLKFQQNCSLLILG